jgi:hypothetical protein
VIALLLLLAAMDETPFEARPERFADAAACKAHLAALATGARGGDYDAVEGPYEIAAGDVRIHTVRSEALGHRIDEQRCLSEKLSGRSWNHRMEAEEAPFTVESVARTAPWLKKGGRE